MRRIPTHIHEWAKGRPVMFVVVALPPALAADWLADGFDLMRKGKVAELLGRGEPNEEWLSFYAKPGQMRDLLGDAGAGSPVTQFLYRQSIESRGSNRKQIAAMLDSLTPDQRRDAEAQVENIIRAAYWETLEQVSADLNDEDCGDFSDVEAPERAAGMRFFFQVWMPCLILYGKSATRMFASCRRGDAEAIEQLLRLDKTIVADPRINGHISDWAAAERIGKLDAVTKGVAGTADLPSKQLNINIAMAGFIRFMARKLGVRLTYKDLRALFDAAERDRTGNSSANEPDLHDDLDAFKQAVYRASDQWEILNDRDKLIGETCHDGFVMRVVVSDFNESEPFPDWTGGQTPDGTAPAGRPVGVVRRLWEWVGAMVGRLLGR